jgi:hypothetical protein
MRGGVILIALALLIGFLGVTGKYKYIVWAFQCMFGSSDACNAGVDGQAVARGGASEPAIIDARDFIAPLAALPPIESFR